MRTLAKKIKQISSTSLFGSISKKQLSMFLRQFSILLNTGIPINDALGILKDQSYYKSLSNKIHHLFQSTLAGKSLSESMRDDRSFSHFLVAMVEAGEHTGTLGCLMEDVASYYEREHDLERKIKNAVTYPIILCLVSIVVVVFVLLYVMPTFVSLFDTNYQALPLPTRLLLCLSGFLQKHYSTLAVLIFGLMAVALTLCQKHSFRLKVDKGLLSIPLVGNNLRNISTSKMARTLSIIVSSGMPFLEGMKLIAGGIHNRFVQHRVQQILMKIEMGSTISGAFSEARIFPKMFLSMLQVGEETGQLSAVLGKTASYYDKDVEYSLNNITAMLEPLLILILAIIIGFIVLAIAIPMFDLINHYDV